MRLPFLLLIMIITSKQEINSQVNWNVNSVQLSPNVFESKGSITVQDSKSQMLVTIPGVLTFFINEKKLLFNDGRNTFDLKLSHLNSVNTEKFGIIPQSNLFTKTFTDSLLSHHRRRLYNEVSLNEIIFSSSKRIEYLFEDGELKLKKQKLSKGKICAVTLSSITVLSEEGELSIFKDGDFNFLQISEFRGLNCKSLYDYIFPIYSSDLKKSIDKWKQSLTSYSIEELLSKFGPIESVIDINSEKRLFTWKRKMEMYSVEVNESVSTVWYARDNYSSWSALFSSISSAFLKSYYNNIDLDLTPSYFSSMTTSNSKVGIVSNDEGFLLGIEVDKNNKILNVYHDNLFADPKYGIPFEFIHL